MNHVISLSARIKLCLSRAQLNRAWDEKNPAKMARLSAYFDQQQMKLLKKSQSAAR